MTDFRPGGLQQLPTVVKNLLIINGLVFLVQYMLEQRGVNVDQLFALHYWQSPDFRWWQMLTHMFMHGSVSHIFFNMFALWMFGRILENLWGPQRFILFYLVCGFGAALCHLCVLGIEFTSFHNAFLHYQQNPGFVQYAQFIKQQHLTDPGYAFEKLLSYWSTNPDCSNCIQVSKDLINQKYSAMINEGTVGASGAVFGLLFAFGYLFPNTELYIYFIPIPIKAKWVVGGYALIELSQGVYNSAGDNIAHFAHLGGMLFAFILLRIWGKNIRNRFY